MSVYDKLFKTADEQKYFRIALPAAVECVFMSFLASADLIMVGSLGAVSIAAVRILRSPAWYFSALPGPLRPPLRC